MTYTYTYTCTSVRHSMHHLDVRTYDARTHTHARARTAQRSRSRTPRATPSRARAWRERAACAGPPAQVISGLRVLLRDAALKYELMQAQQRKGVTPTSAHDSLHASAVCGMLLKPKGGWTAICRTFKTYRVKLDTTCYHRLLRVAIIYRILPRFSAFSQGLCTNHLSKTIECSRIARIPLSATHDPMFIACGTCSDRTSSDKNLG